MGRAGPVLTEEASRTAMKLAFFLLCAIGAASAKFLIEPGKEHVYAYKGRIVSGIPELERRFSGLTIEAKVLMQAGQGRPGTNTFKIALKDVKFSHFNEKLNGPHPFNWRTMETPSTNPVTSAHKAHLESPVVVELENWEVKKVIVSAEEPEWSVNFKKALVAAIKVQLPEDDAHQNRISRGGESWMGMSSGSSFALPPYWTVMEQGVDGICENTYRVSEIPQYMISSVERNLVKMEECQGKRMYQVVRTRDITKCTTRSVFIAARNHDNCLVGKCDGATGKTVSTRFIGCGENKESMKLHAVISEGELQQNLLAFNTEKVVTGTKQVLALEEVKPAPSQLPVIKEPRIVEDLIYEYPKEASVEQKKQINSFRKEQEFFMDQAQNPKDRVFRADGVPRPMDQEMKQKIVQKLSQVVADLKELNHFGQKKVTSVLHALKTVLSVRNVAELKQIYSEVKAKEDERRIFLELVFVSGTSPAIMFCKELIMANELTFVEATEFLVTLPHNIKAPSPKVFEEIYQLIKSPVISERKTLKTNAQIAYATIVRRACFHEYELNSAVFPEDVLGKMCRAHKDHVVSQFIADLRREIEGADEKDLQAPLLALGTLGHESAVSALIPYIEGRAPSAQAQNIDIRQIAIYALGDVSYQHRNTLLPVYIALVLNPVEPREIRLAAFNILLKMNPSVVQMQKLAISTWFEQDEVVAKYIYSSLRSLSNLRREQIPQEDSKIFHLSLKATTVLPLAKKLPGIFSSNFNSFFADILGELQIGYQCQAAMSTTSNSFLVYHKMNVFLKQVKYTPYEFAAQVRGLKSIVVEGLKEIASESGLRGHRELEKIIEKLDISPREQSPVEAIVWARIHNDAQFVYNTPRVNVEYIKEKVRSISKSEIDQELKRNICGKTPIHVKKIFELIPYMAVVPSEMGFPIMVETYNMHVAALEGELNVECPAKALPTVTIEASMKYASSWSGYAGTVSPFHGQVKELLAAGIEKHHSVNFPVHAVVKVEPSTGSLIAHMKQVKQVADHVDIIHMHVLPYTTRKPVVFHDLTPAILDRASTKILRTEVPEKKYEVRVGQSLGLDLKYLVESESDVLDRKTFLDTLRNFRYNPLTALYYYSTITALNSDGLPSLRFHKATLVHNPQSSTTKEVKIDLNVAAAIQEERRITPYIAESSPKKSQQETKLSQTIEKLRSKDAYAVHALVEVALVGGAPKTYTYSVAAAKGATEQEHKWNIHLEDESMPGKICVVGTMDIPVSRESQQKLKYSNKIGFGSSCEEYFVQVDGFARTGEQQIESSRRSEATRKCARLSREVSQLHERMQTQPQGERKGRMEQEHAQLRYEKRFYCQEQRREETSLDKVEVDITASPRLPAPVYTLAKYLDASIKGVLFKYIAGLPAIHPASNPAVKVYLDFNQRLNTVTMRVVSPLDTTLYRNIRLPYFVRNLLPLSFSRSLVEQTSKALLGSSPLAKCVIGQDQVFTFAKKAVSYQLDDCYHLVAADCTHEKRYGVLAKEREGVKHVTVYYGDVKIVLRAPASQYHSDAPYRVEINGVEKELRPREKHVVKTGVKVQWAVDAYTIQVDTPAQRVRYNGKLVVVKEKVPAVKSCGICGESTSERRENLQSPKQCVYKSIKTIMHSYRVEDSECNSRLPSNDRNELKTQSRMCTSQQTVRSQRITQQKHQHTDRKSHPRGPMHNSKWEKEAYEVESQKHAIMPRGGEICLSKEQLPQCAPNSVARAIEPREVEFVCKPLRDREAKEWVRKAKEGRQVSELSSQQKSFSARVELPRDCVRDY